MQQDKIVSQHEIGVLHYNGTTHQKSLHAVVPIKNGEVFSSFRAGNRLSYPTRFTVQLGEDEHIELQPAFLQFINHSCKPNLFFDTQSMQVVCIDNIKIGDELTYFYPSTEWIMEEPFTCRCGFEHCLGEIKGAAFLSQGQVKYYHFTEFIKEKMNLLHH